MLKQNSNQINIEDYDYSLPLDNIAQFPLEQREMSKLLYANLQTNTIENRYFYDLPDILKDDFSNNNVYLVRNSTKVFPARFFLEKETGGRVEILLEAPITYNLPELALANPSPQVWECIVRGRNLNENIRLKGHFQGIEINAIIQNVVEGKRHIQFEWAPNSLSLTEILEQLGKVPLPPYIAREMQEQDKQTYQTIFAEKQGSIAAPTAGLHFTNQVTQKLLENNVQILDLTLHVGSGTFVPIKADSVDEHEMHSEQFQVDIEFLQHLKNALSNSNRKIIATGTTSVRTLESLYWLGVNLIESGEMNFRINQWIWKDKSKNIDANKSIEAIINYMLDQKMNVLIANTQIMIIPGYEFMMIDGLITNFHLPKSTLLLLVSAYVGYDNYKTIYEFALNNDYRFLSYGDANLYLK
jgi:S-adenosylmethionine:tRNA ribosyltransferase-isomerase